MASLKQIERNQQKQAKKTSVVYEIEDILDEKIVQGKKFYLTKWLGYPKNESTWEPTENFTNEIEQVKKEIAKNKSLKEIKKTKRPKNREQKLWEVEDILDEKNEGGVKFYLIKWKNFSAEHNNWEPKESFVGGIDAIKEGIYKNKSSNHPLIRKKISKSKRS